MCMQLSSDNQFLSSRVLGIFSHRKNKSVLRQIYKQLLSAQKKVRKLGIRSMLWVSALMDAVHTVYAIDAIGAIYAIHAVSYG